MIAYSIIFVALAFCFWLTYYIASSAARYAVVFPPQNCTNIEDAYGPLLEKYAYLDALYVSQNAETKSSGCLQCFCDAQLKADPNNTEKLYSDGVGTPFSICGEYSNKMLKILFWTNALSFIIIGLNYFLREACIALINWIGY